ncbi:uncharacterized protein LOC119579810 [Penaeus monodon]|uniref:uncharacterized protein LOC119579808 n=1 Tax=Penaeus monodon TaxID=6687 RepID=UPI0018A70286|nr:uncharacterized protein LOC119579808 [Penaeus monodon]XP_037783622.1 uncharacterized protein LOC119579810 [Penaeus monodon]
MFKISALCVLVLVQVSVGLYYENRPLVCPLKQEVQYEDKVIQATYLEVLEQPLVATHVHLKTVYQTTTLPVTATHIHTVTGPPPNATVTEVQLVETQVPQTVTQIETVTNRLTETVLDVATRTATNYHTLVETVAVLETQFDTVTEVQTRLADITLTLQETEFSTLTWTVSQLETQQVVESIEETSVTTSTEYVPRYRTNVHTLTKMVTQTVCPPSAQHSLKW